MTAKDIERVEKQLDDLPGKLIRQITPIITTEVANLELRITRELGERVTTTEQAVESAHARINGCVKTGRDNGVHINLVDKELATLRAGLKPRKQSVPPTPRKPREVAIKLVIPVASIVGLITGLIALITG